MVTHLVVRAVEARGERAAAALLGGLDELGLSQAVALCRRLESELELPGQVLVLAAGDAAALEDIERQAFEPVHAGPGGA